MAHGVLLYPTVEPNPKDEATALPPHLHCKSCAAFHRSLETLTQAGVPFLVGGGFAVEVYLNAPRAQIKDLDLFLKPEDVGTALQALNRAGFSTRLHEPGWIAKAHDGDDFIDLIFATRNELLTVDDESFLGAPDTEILGMPVKVQPVEEVVATKVFVCARDRFDVSDICHLFLQCSERMDWRRLVERLAPQIEMLHVHLLLFQYVYPGKKHVIPQWVYDEVEARAKVQRERVMPTNAFRGLALDPTAFAIDIERWGLFDARRPDRFQKAQERAEAEAGHRPPGTQSHGTNDGATAPSDGGTTEPSGNDREPVVGAPVRAVRKSA